MSHDPDEIAHLRKQVDAVLRQTEDSAYRTRLDQIIAAAEDAQRRADSEALRASQAKQACEDHSSATSTLRAKAEVDSGAIVQLKVNVEEVERSISATRTKTDDIVKSIEASRDKLKEAQKWIADSLPAIEKNADSISVLKKEMDALIVQGKEAVAALDQGAIDGKRQLVRQSEAVLQIEAFAKSAQASSQAASDSMVSAEQHAEDTQAAFDQIKGLISELKGRQDDLTKQREILEELVKDNKELNRKALELLPHAASAGLASAFLRQKQRFKNPQRIWVAVFGAAICALLILAVPDFLREVGSSASGVGVLNSTDTESIAADTAVTDTSWDGILRQTIRRLPIVIPLIWLAIYAGRNYSMALRLEEDYAYKEAISTAFEGYRREMGNIPQVDGASAIPLHTLCENVLAVLNQRPGRIYEGEHKDVTPISPLMDSINKLADSIKSKGGSQE